MTTYYRDDSVRVSSSSVGVAGREHPVPELAYVWHRRTRLDRRTLGRLAVRVGLIGLLVAPLAARVAASTQVWTSDRPLPHKLGAALGLTVVSLAVLAFLLPLIEVVLSGLERSYDHGATTREIWIRCRGEDILVLRTADTARFRAVYRAIQRTVARDERLRRG